MIFNKQFLKKDLLIIGDFDNSYSKDEKESEEKYLKKLFKQIKPYGVKVFYEEALNANELKRVLKKYDKKKTIIFNWCERFNNIDGNEGDVTEVYAKLGFTFTGCDSKGLRLLSNKYKCVQQLKNAGIKAPKSYLVKMKDYETFDPDFSKRYIVKSNVMHASLGITDENVVSNKKEFLKVAKRYKKDLKSDMIVQEFLTGKEYTVMVWGNKKPTALPILSVDFHKVDETHIRTYVEKFGSDTEEYSNCTYSFLNKKKNQKLYSEIEKVVIKTFKALDLHDYARLDVLFDGKDVYVIDANANPYINELTDDQNECEVYISTAKVGYNWAETILQICEFAYKRGLK